jgi:hypothetical protein
MYKKPTKYMKNHDVYNNVYNKCILYTFFFPFTFHLQNLDCDTYSIFILTC